MKLYSLYEFPKDETELKIIINYVDRYQPVEYNRLLDLISETIIKANSRTNITLKMLKKLGFLEGNSHISLSSTAQIYQDLKKSFKDLSLYLTYVNKELFEECKLIFKLTDNANIPNTILIEQLHKMGFEDSKRTAQEKIYAIKRLIELCKKDNYNNPFHEYEEYIEFLIKLHKQYYLLSNGKKNQPIPIQKLKRKMMELGISNEFFDYNFVKLYNDPIHSMYTSFTTVINEFANEKYYKILEKNYYYFKMSDLIFLRK